MASASPAPRPTQTSTPSTSLPVPSTATPDLPAQAAAEIVKQVEAVRAKTTGPAIRAAQYLVFAFFGLIVGTLVLLVAIIGIVRLVDNYLPNSVFGEEHMWATYLVTGVPLVIGGLLASRKMSKKAA